MDGAHLPAHAVGIATSWARAGGAGESRAEAFVYVRIVGATLATEPSLVSREGGLTMNEQLIINLTVFIVAVLAVGVLAYRLGFIRGAQRRRRHKIVPTVVEKEEKGT
jgi:hypothetical protein